MGPAGKKSRVLAFTGGSSAPRVLLSILMLLASGFGADAEARQLDQPDSTQTYEHIWESIDDDLWEAVVELRTFSPAWHPERASSKVLVANANVVERVIDATKIPATPPPAEGEGWGQLAGDTRNQRRTAHLLSVDADRLLAEGNADAAVERITAILRFGRQLAADPRLTSTAMAATCIEIATELVDRATKEESLTEQGRRELAVAVQSLNQGDPAGFKVGLSGACRLHAWIAREFKGSNAGEQLVASLPIPEERKRPLEEGMREERGRRGFSRRSGGLWASRELIAELREMDGDEIEGAAKEFEEMHKAAMAMWDEPDARELLEVVDMRADRSAYGPFARLTPPYFSRQRRHADQVDENMARMRFSLVVR